MKETFTPTIPNPKADPVAEAHAFYSLYYGLEKNDSPNESRKSMIGRIEQAAANLSPCDVILDIGAGIQVLEAEYIAKNGNSGPRFITLDISSIKNRGQLLAPVTEHIIASGTQIPLAYESVGLVVSNMALDFIPKDALSEVARVMKQNAQLLLNMHHPSLVPPDLNRRIRSLEQKIRFQGKPPSEKQTLRRASLQHKKYLKDENVLYCSSIQIRETFEPLGFEVKRIEQVFGGGDTWWEADMVKSKGGGER